MGLFVERVPQGTPGGFPAASWQPYDVATLSIAAPLDGGGALTLDLAQIPAGERWELLHAAMVCPAAPPQPRLRLYVNDTGDPRNIRSGSDAGGFDEADWPRGLWVFENDTLIATWSRGPAGAVVGLALQYTLWRAG